MRRGRLPFVVGLVFGGVGIVLAVVAVIVVGVTLGALRDGARTEGTVVDVVARTSTTEDSDGRSRESTAYHPTVRFRADGRTYTFTSSTGSDPPAYEVGDRVPVVYDPADPGDARVNTFWSLYLAPIVLGGLAVVFLAVGVPLFRHGRSRLRRDGWLRANGREVWAEIQEVGFDYSTRINGRHPYVVRASWYDPDTGRTHAAESDPLRHDPGPGLRGRTQVRVLLDPSNPDDNVMDLDTARTTS